MEPRGPAQIRHPVPERAPPERALPERALPEWAPAERQPVQRLRSSAWLPKTLATSAKVVRPPSTPGSAVLAAALAAVSPAETESRWRRVSALAAVPPLAPAASVTALALTLPVC